MSVYLRLFHGRNTSTEDLDDWGFDGPTIGPLDYVHVTYGSHIKFSHNGENKSLYLVNDCVEHEKKFYGDFSITSEAIK